MADIERLRVPVELGLELGTVVGLQYQNAERKALSDLVQAAYRRALVAGIVDLENAYTGAVIYGRELVELFARPWDAARGTSHPSAGGAPVGLSRSVSSASGAAGASDWPEAGPCRS